ncbi:MAG: hypothetical protein ACJ0DH_00785 [bacterium]
MLSFCAQPQGGVAESIIQRITLVLREGGRLRRWVRTWNQCFPPSLIRFDGTFSPGRRYSFAYKTVDSATSCMNSLRAE